MNENLVENQNDGTTPSETINNLPQNPIEQELERETKKGEGRTEAEKAAFSLKKNADRVKELGLDPEEILGIKKEEKQDDEVPEWYKKIESTKTKETALTLAEGIPDEFERKLVKQYLQTRIIPSGDPHEDLRFARLAVNSVKNTQVVEELNRGVVPSRFSSGAGAPPKQVPTGEIELTADEKAFASMKGSDGKPLFTPEQIVKLNRPQQ